MILSGHCQVTVVDPEGETEVANYGPGDLWYFPKGHVNAMQTIGSEPCHAPAPSKFSIKKCTHRFRLMAQAPRVASPGGTIHVASAREYPISQRRRERA
jgi:hypothetical protein